MLDGAAHHQHQCLAAILYVKAGNLSIVYVLNFQFLQVIGLNKPRPHGGKVLFRLHACEHSIVYPRVLENVLPCSVSMPYADMMQRRPQYCMKVCGHYVEK